MAVAVSVPIVVDSLPHSPTHYTQGLFWDSGLLWESTGLVGRSGLYRYNSQGQLQDSLRLGPPHFGEGLAKMGDRLAWLTWKSGVGFLYNASDFSPMGSFSIPTEGWGLTTWRGEWLMSNGSDELLRLSALDFRVVGVISVRAAGVPVRSLNELETVGDTLFANVWQRDSIAVIALPSGQVVRWIDFSKKAQQLRRKYPQAEVLNGIAWDGKSLWVTGKLWPWIYRWTP